MSILPVRSMLLGPSRSASGVVSVMVQSSAVVLRGYGWVLAGVPVQMDVLGLRTVLVARV